MAKQEITEIECMLVVLYKKLDDIQGKMKGSTKLASLSSYYQELKKEAQKVKENIESNK